MIANVRNPGQPRRPFDFGANHHALDFVNTVNGRPDFTRDDLTGPDDLVEWAVAAGLVMPDDRARVGGASSSRFEAAVGLRENLYQVFGPIALGDTPHSASLSLLTRRAAQAMRSSEWQGSERGYSPFWPDLSIDGICDRLADEAVQLLRSPLITRVGSCAGCGWLFLDVSRAHARRWCSMNACGVRDKMRRYHQRQLGMVAT